MSEWAGNGLFIHFFYCRRGASKMITAIVDNVKYKSKPTSKDYPSINNRLANKKASKLNISEFGKALQEGRPYIAGELIDTKEGRKAHNIKNINIISLDIDNHYKDKNGQEIETSYTREQVINKVQELTGATPVIVYDTFTGENANGSKRFRVIYRIDKFCNHKDIKILLNYIIESTGDMFDKSVDTAKIYQGTNKIVEILEDSKPINYELIEKLQREQEQKEKQRQELQKKREVRRSTTDYIDNDLVEYLKSEIDITDYLLRLGYSDMKKTLQGYKMPCPIHKGKKDNFHISRNNGTWVYYCFSGCGGKGGSIIDLHMELVGTDEGQAINELAEMFNIQRKKADIKPVKEVNIDKYISNDKKATGSIFKALEGNKRVALIAPMGTGKTHFIINDLYKHAQQLGKKVILVVPGAKQLENLADNKGVAVVFHKMPVYMGNDLVATTPDSLPKITAELEDNSYILAVDETHERYTSRYREAYKNNNIEKAEKKAYRTIHMTATPRILFNDDFEDVITIISQSIIENDIHAVKVKGSFNDSMHSLAKKYIRQGKQPILFNNNKKDNDLMASIIQTKEKITMLEYEEGQLNIFTPRVKEVTKEKITTTVETVQSGKDNPGIAKGVVSADFTATTSSIMAGIDLETDREAVLIVNTTNLVVDNLIQLIGRFRKGIKVILLAQEQEKKVYQDFETVAKEQIKISKGIAQLLNESPIRNLDRTENSLVTGASLILEDGLYVVDEKEIVQRELKHWSNAVLSHRATLKAVLKDTKAFKAKTFKFETWKVRDNTVSQLKNLTKKDKDKKIKELTKELLKLPDDELESVLKGDTEIQEYQDYRSEQRDTISEIRRIGEKLNKELVEGFRYYHTTSKSNIKKELEQVDVKKVNRIFKESGSKVFLQMKDYKSKKTREVVQAQIRHKFKDLEEKQGRITKQWLNALTYHLVFEDYLMNKQAKIYKESYGKPELKEQEQKAFDKLKSEVMERLHLIYNITEDRRISSIKY